MDQLSPNKLNGKGAFSYDITLSKGTFYVLLIAIRRMFITSPETFTVFDLTLTPLLMSAIVFTLALGTVSKKLKSSFHA